MKSQDIVFEDRHSTATVLLTLAAFPFTIALVYWLECQLLKPNGVDATTMMHGSIWGGLVLACVVGSLIKNAFCSEKLGGAKIVASVPKKPFMSADKRPGRPSMVRVGPSKELP